MAKTGWRKRMVLRLSLALIAVIVAFVAIFVALVELMPFDASKLTPSSTPTVVYAGDGSVYMTLSSQGGDELPYNKIPTNLTNAIVAVEDHNFWDGSSIDFRGLARATFIDLWSKSYEQGASTIQEQLAKIVYLKDKKTLGRKMNQIVLGVQINRHFTKQEILSMYLNRVFLGENAVGVKAAAWRYFGIDIEKNPNQLTLEQAALLAGLPQAPTSYDPIKHPEAALVRRNIVLEQMAKYGYITEQRAKQAEKTPIGKLEYHSLPGDAWDNHPLFTNFLFDYAAKEANIQPEELLQGGLKVYTTINPKVQSSIEKVFWNTNYNNDFPGPTSGTVVQGAALFVDPKTGGILGGAGSRKQGFAYYGLDRIYSSVSPGSSIKPVMEYGAAVESGKWGPDSMVNNQPQNFGNYRPRNDDPGAPARMTLQNALATSQNVAAVWLLQQIGINTGADFAEKLGIPITQDDRKHLGIAVGGLEQGVNTMQMAGAYEAYANNGVQMDVHLISKITNQSGDTVYQSNPAGQRVVSEQTAATMTQLLQSVVQYGTGTAAQVPGWDVAGKTGTVQYDAQLQGQHLDWIRNAWFDGYTPTMVGSIYIGYDMPSTAHHMTDVPHFPSYNCAKLFGDIVSLATAGDTPQRFNLPSAPATNNTQAPVTNLQASWDGTINALNLKWDSPLANQVTFVVKRSAGTPAENTDGNNGASSNSSAPGNADSYTVIGQTNQTSIEDTTVQPGMTYTYVVQAVDSQTNQPLTPAATLNVTIQSQAPPDLGGANNTSGGGDGTDNGTGGDSGSPGAPGSPGGTDNSTGTGNSTGGGAGNPPGGPGQPGGPGGGK